MMESERSRVQMRSCQHNPSWRTRYLNRGFDSLMSFSLQE